MIEFKASESICIPTELNMKGSGSRINSMGKELKHGLIRLNI